MRFRHISLLTVKKQEINLSEYLRKLLTLHYYHATLGCLIESEIGIPRRVGKITKTYLAGEWGWKMTKLL